MKKSKIVRVVMLGGGWIGQMHAIALRNIKSTRNDPPVEVDMVAICDKDRESAEMMVQRFGFKNIYTDWKEMIKSQDFDLFVNCAPNYLHGEPSIEAAKKGAHIMIEKPLAKNADESYETWKAIQKEKVIHASAYVWMAVPAIRTMREMIKAGELGEIYNFQSNFFMNMVEPDGSLTWRFDKNIAGAGVIGDNVSHHIQTARFLLGEFERVASITRTIAVDPKGIITDKNEDGGVFIAEMENGVMAAFNANRCTPGHQVTAYFQVDGSRGSVSHYVERLNEINIRMNGKGELTMLATKPEHPSADMYVPIGVQGALPFGWTDCFTMEDLVVVNAVANGTPIRPYAADLEDAYRVEEIVDTVLYASQTKKFEDIKFRK
jgi:predicted dehydrogenase